MAFDVIVDSSQTKSELSYPVLGGKKKVAGLTGSPE